MLAKVNHGNLLQQILLWPFTDEATGVQNGLASHLIPWQSWIQWKMKIRFSKAQQLNQKKRVILWC